MPTTSQVASAGTLESSDCLVTVQRGEESAVTFEGANVKLFEERNRRIADEVISAYGLKGAVVRIQDQGAIEATLAARMETAIERFLAIGVSGK